MTRCCALALALLVPRSLAAQVPGDEPPPAEAPPGPVMAEPPPSSVVPFDPFTPQRAAAEQMWLGPFRPAEPTSYSEPLIPTAIAELAAGGAMLALGGILWGTAQPEQQCAALAGCIDVYGDDALVRREAGVTFVGLGSGLAVFGGATLALLAADPLEPGEARDGPGAAVTGHLLFGVGLSTFAAGFAYGAAADPRRVDYERPWAFYLFGLTATAVGIPLFVAGVSREDEQERQEERLRAPRPKPRPIPTAITIGPTGGAATWAW